MQLDGLHGLAWLDAWRAQLAGDPMEPVVPAGLPETARRTADARPEEATDDELLTVVTELESIRRALDAALVHHVAEVDRRGLAETRSGLRTAGWLGWSQKMARPTAASLVCVGAHLRSHPVSDAALADGRLSMDHVKVLARHRTPRVSEEFDQVEPQLIDLATDTSFEVWARTVRALLDLADADGGHAPHPADNRLSMVDGFDADTLHLAAELTGADAVEVRAALDAEADRLFRAHRREHDATGGDTPLPTRAQLLAEALVELCRRGRAALHHSSAPVADVTLVLEAHPGPLDSANTGRVDTTHGDELHHWLRGLHVRTLDGLPITRPTAEVLCCDPQIRALVMSTDGEPLWHGRARRLASPAQRRAAAVRFGGCCFPGCDAPPTWCDLHHVHPWDTGGTTDQPKLAPLCRRHHGVIHRRGWAMRPAPHGFDITTPTGTVHPCQARGRTPAPA
jgi:hypothetical protein